MISVYRKLYGILGSGGSHSPYGIFMKYSREHYGNHAVGLIRAADTRMAGYFAAFTRLLRLKDPLLEAVRSQQYKKMSEKSPDKKKATKMKWAKNLLLNKSMWKRLFTICQAVYPALLILRTADKSEAGMHVLYYHLRKCKEAMKKHINKLNRIKHIFKAKI